MSNLLTHEEYSAIANSLSFPTNAFINGQFQSSKSGKTFETINPATGNVIAKVAACNADDVDHAVIKAREVFDQGHWSKLHPSERKKVLIKLSKLIKRNLNELAVMESVDSGKPVRDCATIDLPETIDCLLWHAEAIDKIYDQTALTFQKRLTVCFGMQKPLTRSMIKLRQQEKMPCPLSFVNRLALLAAFCHGTFRFS